MNTYFVAGASNSVSNTEIAIAIKAKSLSNAKIIATKLSSIEPSIINSNMIVLGDHITTNGYIDHVLATKTSFWLKGTPRWFYDPVWVEHRSVKS